MENILNIENSITKGDSQIKEFVIQTYKLFGASLMAGAMGAYVGIPIASVIAEYYWPMVILEVLLLIGLFLVKKAPGINIVAMFAFTFVSGLTLAPLISSVIGMTGGAMVVGNAFAMTSLVFGALSYFAIKTKKDFTQYGKTLMIALFVIIGVSLINILFLGSSVMAMIISGASTMLFSVLVIFDTQNIIKGAYETPIDGAIALYLDFLNIFINILSFFASSSDD